MSDISFEKYGNEEFFKHFFSAVKETYGEYCAFKEREENCGYSEPVFEKAIPEAEKRIVSIEQQLAKANELVNEYEQENRKLLSLMKEDGWDFDEEEEQ